MPYIDSEPRQVFNPQIEALIEQLTHFGENRDPKPGEVNYVVSKLIWGLLRKNGMSYTRVNNLIGALECVKLELYRRLAAPYEDTKIQENGDI